MSKLKNWFFPHDHKPYHVKALDGLRGLAVLLVLLSHSSNSHIQIHPVLDFAGIGKLGVYLFYVLSAYLLDRQIALAFQRKTADKRYWLNYCIRRVLRIYPLFALALLTYLMLTYLGMRTSIYDGKVLTEHLLLVRGDAVFWSIPVELKYYLLSPIFMAICHYLLRWNKRWVYLFFIALTIGSIALPRLMSLGDLNTLRYLPIFLVGSFISIYEIMYAKSPISKSLADALGWIALIIMIMLIPSVFSIFFGIHIGLNRVLLFFPLALLLGVLLFSLSGSKGRVSQLFEMKWLRYIGSISFSMYLFHGPVLGALKNDYIPLDGAAAFIVFVLLTTLVSSITYLLIERPLSVVNLKYLEEKFRLKKSEISR